MLTIYRRHRKECSHRKDGRAYRRCHCPIWVDGFLADAEMRKSLGTRDWQKAQDTIRQWEADGQRTKDAREPETLEHVKQCFLADAEARNLHESTIYKYRLLFRQLETFASEQGIRFVKELDVEMLSAFRSRWKDGPRSSLKKLERLRALLGFCQKRRWIEDNPARDLKPPKVPARPTMPFTRDEVMKILVALVDKYALRAGVANAARLRAFVLTLRYSGMRIGDVVGLSTDRIVGSKLFLYTQKTGVAVHCVLPDFVLAALENSPRSSSRHFFWTGLSKMHSAIGKWQRRLGVLFEMAEVRGGHAHRFRDTFAVELLLAGIPLERVSILLGHSSVRITERHYAPWVRARQEQLEADLQRAWSEDPVVLLETKGTPEVHGKSGTVN
jgi:integrase